ncbi:MAG TPA: protein kinase [Methylomirabilota bacterium]
MSYERDLAETAIAQDFFGPAGLGDDGRPPAPDKYVVERRLGQGGGGAVYLATDTTLGRPVALKYLSHSRPAEIERFLREARFAARLRHPAIVQVYEAGEIEGQPFIAMQYIPGESLAAAPLDLEGTLRVTRQVAEALAHAHDQGIVHRDVKPENILVDGDGRAYITDFGIARDLRAEMGGTISHEGHILGTPGLMSPEQARGEVRAIDGRTDVYALGATLYYKLTHRLPFSAGNFVDLLHAVIHDDPPFPRTHRPDIPRDVEALVLRCMRKRRDERYGSMREVIAAMDRLAAGSDTVKVSPVWFTTYVRRKVEDAPAEPARPSTDHDWSAALEAAREIASWDMHLYRVRSDLQRHFPRLDDLIARLTAILAERPSTGWARFYRGVAWFRRGELRRALDDMERSIDRVGDLAGAHFELGRLYLAIFLDEHQEAHKHLTRGGTDHQLRNARSRLDQASIALAEAQRLKHDVPAWQLGYANAVRRLAEADYEGCVAECDRILAGDPDLDEVWKLKGDALRRAKRDALPAYERTLEIRRSCYEALLAMADVHLEAGAVPDARDCLARALEIHGGLAAARVLLARSHLVEARETGRDDLLRVALAEAERAVDAAPDRYDAVITLAEAQIECAGRQADPAWVARALDTLAGADQLDGCGNRVEYLRARARLARAQLLVAAGGDPRPDLEAVLTWRDHVAAHMSDSPHWRTLIADAEQLLGKYMEARSP